MTNLNKKKKYDLFFFAFTSLTLLLFSELAQAGANTNMSLGNMASTIYGSFTSVTRLITAGSYLAGIGFAVGAIMKFKQHKDNPTQMTIGTPIALVFIAAALLFLPSILGVAGATMFGSTGGKSAGPTGTIIR